MATKRIAWRFLFAASLALLVLAGAPAAFAQWEGCTAPAWSDSVRYDRGSVVSHDYREWKAKRNTSGVEPGTHKPTWQDLGGCAGAPPPEPPPEPPPPPPTGSSSLQIFGVWHAGNHYADWALPRDTRPGKEFDRANHWIIDRGDGSGRPSVNLVVLSFLNPLEVLDMSPGAPETGVPLGMSQEVVDYFKNAGIRVMMSIGGITYTDYWDQALAADAVQLGLNAAAIATHFGVGIEIDYERNVGANLAGLEAFIAAYRDEHPYDASGSNAAARLTIDLAAGDRYLQELTRYATEFWLDNANPVLDYANAMVARSSGTPDNWQEHVDGKSQYDPPIPPLAPNRFTGGLYLKGSMANCTDFWSSEQYAYVDYVESVAPNGAGTSNGMLGFMFWAAEYPSARKNYVATVPPNSCEGGMGMASEVFDIPVPMPPLRQE
jgi:hypothetical protein